MLYDRVMRNIQNRHKDIKHMNSFINVRRQRKLRKFLENPLSWSQVSGPTFRIRLLPMNWVPGIGSQVLDLGSHLQCPGSRVLRPTYEMILLSLVPPKVPGLVSHFSDIPILRAQELKIVCFYMRTFIFKLVTLIFFVLAEQESKKTWNKFDKVIPAEGCISVKSAKFLATPFFYRTPPVAASEERIAEEVRNFFFLYDKFNRTTIKKISEKERMAWGGESLRLRRRYIN